MPATGRLRSRIRITDIARIVDATAAARGVTLRARIEIAIRSTFVIECAVRIILWALSAALRGTHRQNAERQAQCTNSEEISHLQSPFEVRPPAAHSGAKLSIQPRVAAPTLF